MRPGDIANDNGDIYLGRNITPLAGGRILLPFKQAFKALQWGWSWESAMILGPQTVDIWVKRNGNVCRMRVR